MYVCNQTNIDSKSCKTNIKRKFVPFEPDSVKADTILTAGLVLSLPALLTETDKANFYSQKVETIVQLLSSKNV